jgi:hypothetical protein
MKSYLACLVILTIVITPAIAKAEYVTVIKVLENDDRGIIERRNGERWLIEKGIGALSFWRCEGKKVLIDSPGLFCGIGSKLIITDSGQEARIWKAEQIDSGRSSGVVATTDTELALQGLSYLGYYSKESKPKSKSDAVLSLVAFQKASGLIQTGKVSFESQMALSKAILAKKPVTKQSLLLASSLLDSAKRMLAEGIPSMGTKKQELVIPDLMEGRIDDKFEGWKGKTVVRLTNGQIWQQTEPYYYYRYSFMPKVIILKSGVGYKMVIDGVPKAIGVKQLK